MGSPRLNSGSTALGICLVDTDARTTFKNRRPAPVEAVKSGNSPRGTSSRYGERESSQPMYRSEGDSTCSPRLLPPLSPGLGPSSPSDASMPEGVSHSLRGVLKPRKSLRRCEGARPDTAIETRSHSSPWEPKASMPIPPARHSDPGFSPRALPGRLSRRLKPLPAAQSSNGSNVAQSSNGFNADEMLPDRMSSSSMASQPWDSRYSRRSSDSNSKFGPSDPALQDDTLGVLQSMTLDEARISTSSWTAVDRVQAAPSESRSAPARPIAKGWAPKPSANANVKNAMFGLGENLSVLLQNEADDPHLEEMLESMERSCIPTEEQKEESAKLLRLAQECQLEGADALRFLLESKFGTLGAAFTYFDFSDSGRFSRAAFEAAMIILHIDVEAVTGKKRQDAFADLDRHHEASVSKESYAKYFGLLESELEATLTYDQKPKRRYSIGYEPPKPLPVRRESISSKPSEPPSRSSREPREEHNKPWKVDPSALRRRHSTGNIKTPPSPPPSAKASPRSKPMPRRHSISQEPRRVKREVSTPEPEPSESPELPPETPEEFHMRVLTELGDLHGTEQRRVYDARDAEKRAIVEKLARKHKLWCFQKGNELCVVRIADQGLVVALR